MPSSFMDNPLVRYLEEKTPEAILYAGLPAGASPGMSSFARGHAPQALDRYMGEQTRNLLGGQAPEEMFTDWWRRNISAPWAGRQDVSPMQAQQRGTQRAYRRYGMQGTSGLAGPIGRFY